MKPAAVLVVALLAATPARAQGPELPDCGAQPATYRDFWCLQVREIMQARVGFPDNFQDRIRDAISIKNENLRAFVLFAQARSRALDFALVEDARVDKQVGAPAAAPGSTSLVSKGSVPSILGFAVENGALTQTAAGTKITLRGTAVGWLDLVQNQGFIASYEDDAWFTRALRRVSYSLTLNTDNTPAAPATAGGVSLDAIRNEIRRTDQQLDAYSVRLAIVDRRDPRTAANRERIATVLDTQGVALLASDNAFNDFFNSDEYAIKWVEETTARLADTEHTLSADEVERILYQQLESVRLLMISRIENFDDKVSKVLFALQAFEKARERLFETMQKQKLMALEYVAARTPDAPDRHTVRFIWEQQMGPRVDFTANVAGSFQSGTATPGAASSLEMRDFQAAAELDIPLGTVQKRVATGAGIGVPVFAIAYLAQNLTEHATIFFAGRSFDLDKGMIHALQAKLSIPVKASGVKIPLSLSYANRSELIREKTIRGNVGLTFDMDVLTSLIR